MKTIYLMKNHFVHNSIGYRENITKTKQNGSRNIQRTVTDTDLDTWTAVSASQSKCGYNLPPAMIRSAENKEKCYYDAKNN